MRKKHDIEKAAEKLLKELARAVSAFRKTFLTLPKMKDRNYQLISTTLWMVFTLSLVIIFRRPSW